MDVFKTLQEGTDFLLERPAVCQLQCVFICSPVDSFEMFTV